MNRRPNQSRNDYDSFAPSRAARFTASTPDARFFDDRKKKTPGFRLFIIFLALLAAVLVFNFISNQFVHVARIDVPVKGLSETFDGFTLLHLSDLKGTGFGSNQQRFSLALRKASFDAVVITGDMISAHGSAESFYQLLDQLHAINPSAPVYFIAGDSDPIPVSMTHAAGGSPFAPWVLGAQQRHAHLLSGAQAIRRKEEILWLTSGTHLNLDLDTMQRQFEELYIQSRSSKDENAVELAVYNLKWLEETRSARAAMTDDDVIISLMHAPPAGEELAGAVSGSLLPPVDLIVCGHHLGGLLRLPVLGALFIPSGSLERYGLLPGRNTHYGIRREKSTNIYVSPGLGSESDDYPPFFFRLFNPPTATLLTLTPSAL